MSVNFARSRPMRKKIHIWIFLLCVLTSSSCKTEKVAAEDTQQLGKVVASSFSNPEMLSVSPLNIRNLLSEIAILDSNGPNEFGWDFTATTVVDGIQWAIAEFQPNVPEEDNKWVLLQIRVGIDEKHNMYSQIKTALTDELGKPVFDNLETTEKISIWQLAPYHEILLREGNFEDPVKGTNTDQVLLEFAVIQGEPEEE